MQTTLVPDALIDARGVRRGLALALDADAGVVADVLPAEEAGENAVRLPGLALAPGFPNAHSHAFQRDLRGAVERVSGPAGDDFWSWREGMYALADRLDPESVHEVSRRTFRELRAAGYAAVGEFHYVHHQPDGTPYAEPNAMAEAVCRAAEAEGLRIVLLLAAYQRGGAGVAPRGAQRRFCDPSVEAYLERLDALAAFAEGRPLVSVGAAAHSVRAVSLPWLRAIAAHCRERGLPLHVHADEQPREIEECLAEHGVRPIEVLAQAGALGERTTVVHATHADERELELLAAHGATVCVCPTTEANLGDGDAPAQALLRAGVPVAIGSDSNVRVDPFEELRELELGARRRALRRNVLVAPGDRGPATTLLRSAWQAGARSLGLAGTGGIEPGAPADFAALDLGHPQIAAVADEHLPAAIVFAGSAALVRRTWVAGRPEPTPA